MFLQLQEQQDHADCYYLLCHRKQNNSSVDVAATCLFSMMTYSLERMTTKSDLITAVRRPCEFRKGYLNTDSVLCGITKVAFSFQ